jgi:hypothetical protein
MKSWILSSCVVCGLLLGAEGQFPPKREGITVVQSKFHENVSISFKEVSGTRSNPSKSKQSYNSVWQPGICETTPGAKSYSGYVHLPPHFLEHEDQDYPINTLVQCLSLNRLCH